MHDGEINPDLLRTVFSAIDEGFCLCEMIVDGGGQPVDYRFLAVNPLFEAMTGLDGAVGRTALDLVPDLERHWIDTYGHVALKREPLRFSTESRALGRWFDVFAAPVDPYGRFVIVFRDVTGQRRAEAAHEQARLEAERLLQELNHRVVNSLAMIGAIIGLEARARTEGTGRRVLERLRQRVGAIADLYRTLDQVQSSSEVAADRYLGAVLAQLASSVSDASRIAIRAEIEPIVLTTRVAAPVGLMVNELVTNSLKYAFAADETGEITVTLRRSGEGLALVVSDTGRGVLEDAGRGGGIGRRLVRAFAEQLAGQVVTSAGAEGTVVTVSFPHPGPAEGDAGAFR